MALLAHVGVCLLLGYKYLCLMSYPHHPKEEPPMDFCLTPIDSQHQRTISHPLHQHPIVQMEIPYTLA